MYPLQRRIVTLTDIPNLAPYLFVEPDLSTDEAQKMLKRIESDRGRLKFGLNLARRPQHPSLIAQILHSASSVVRDLVDSGKWESTSVSDLVALLHKERDRLGLKTYLMGLRHALTGMKVKTSSSRFVPC